jgi:tyrosyl-tRNA synthetase
LTRSEITDGVGIIDALSAKTGFLSSNGEARRELKGNAISVNKSKVNDQFTIDSSSLINDKYILLGKGKKKNYIIVVE